MKKAAIRDHRTGSRVGSAVALLLAQTRSWMRAVVRRRRLEAEMEVELAYHLEALTADLIRDGLAPAEAARSARIELGATTVCKEGMRASLGLRWWDELWADLRHAQRMLRKSPGFTVVAVSSLALAIGANTAIFSSAKQVLFDRLRVPHPEQLRLLGWYDNNRNAIHNMWGDNDTRPDGALTSSVFSYPVYRELHTHNSMMQDMFAFKEDWMNATIRGNARRVQVEMVSGNYYAGLGVLPQLGRSILEADDAVVGSGSVAVISDSLWRREFGRSPAALGQAIKLNGAVLTIIGVNPPGFTGALSVQPSPEIFLPLSMQPLVHPMTWMRPDSTYPSLMSNPDLWWLHIMSRVKAGVKDSEARAALDVELGNAVRSTVPLKGEATTPNLTLDDGSRSLGYYLDGRFHKPVYALMALSGFVLLLACANIANLLLARGSQRQREMGVRLALGAGRGRILRQLFTESLFLAALGGLGGLALGFMGRNVIPTLMTVSWQANEIQTPFDWGVFGFAAGVTLVTGILFGLAPAWMASRVEVGSNLKESAQTATRRRNGVGGKALVTFQIALSTLLVVSAGLFLRTLLSLNSVDVGFNADNLLLFEINPPEARYPEGRDVQLHSRLEAGLEAIPGVEQVAAAWEPYISGMMSNVDFLPEGETHGQHKRPAEYINIVGNNFFQTMVIPIVAGRAFGSQDTVTSQKVAVINESLARKRFPGVNPIGRRFKAPDLLKDDWIQIVGVCADTHYDQLRDNPPPQFMLPYVQQPNVGKMTYAIRTHIGSATLAPALRKVVQSLDRDLPIIDIRTQREQIDAAMTTERTFAALTTCFGVLALVLACVGIYGVMACSVANRRNEIGIRLSLGALPKQIQGMVLREIAWLAGLGVGVGLVSTLFLIRIVKSMFFGIQPYDPPTLVAGVLLLLTLALGSGWLPARRAAAVQPMEALRHE